MGTEAIKRINNDSDFLANIVKNTVGMPVLVSTPVEVKSADELNLQIQEDIRNTIVTELNSEDTKVIAVVFNDEEERVDDLEEESEEDEEDEIEGEFKHLTEEEHEDFWNNHHRDNDTGEPVFDGNRRY